ncbi:MAG: S-layer homology domain-containing protein [Methanobacterium sp.]
MNRIKRCLSGFLTLTLLFYIIAGLVSGTSADAGAAESDQIWPGVSEWMLDEERGYIYVTQTDYDQLMILRSSDLRTEKVLPLEAPTDLELLDGKLYVSLSTSAQIAVIDLASKTQEKVLHTSLNPDRLAIDGSHLFYTPYRGPAWQPQLYVYDLSNDSDQAVPLALHTIDEYQAPFIAVDREQHLLYSGDGGGSMGRIAVISTIDYRVVQEAPYDENISGKLILDGNDVFYSGHRYQADQLDIIHGFYIKPLVYVKGNYVFSKNAVYDREKFTKIADLPIASDHIILDKNNNLYVYDANSYQIKKLPFNPTPAASSYQNTANRLDLGKGISDWKIDEQNGSIYALCKDSNSLLFINLADLRVEKEIYVGSAPSNMDISGDKIYIALSGATKIAVASIASRSLEKTVLISKYPDRIAVDGNKLFYNEGIYSGANLLVHNLADDSLPDLEIFQEEYSLAHNYLLTDKTKHILYAGGYNSIKTINTADYALTHNIYLDSDLIHTDLSRKIILDQQDIFTGGLQLDADNPGIVKSSYQQDVLDIVCVQGGSIFSVNAVYDRNSGIKKMDLPFSSPFILADSQAQIYWFDTAHYSVHRMLLNISQPPDSNYQNLGNRLILDKDISDWVYDQSGNYLYAISKSTNKLLKIRGDNLKVEREINIGSQPVDMALYNGKIYTALQGATRVAVVDTADADEISYLDLSSNPCRIAVGAGKMFYVGEKEPYLWEYDFAAAKSSVRHIDGVTNFGELELIFDDADEMLYASSTSAVSLFAVNTRDYTLKDSFTQYSDVSISVRKAIKAGSKIYYAGYCLDVNDFSAKTPDKSAVVYNPDNPWPYFNNNHDVKNQVVALPFRSNQVAVSEEGKLYFYAEPDKTFYCYNSITDLTSNRPRNISWTFGTETIPLTWDEVSGAEAYNVYYESLTKPGVVKMNASPLTENSYMLTVPGPLHSSDAILVGVTAVVNGQESSLSDRYVFSYGHNQFFYMGPPYLIQNSLGAEYISTKTGGSKISTLYVDDTAFINLLDKLPPGSDAFEINVQADADVVDIMIPGENCELLTQRKLKLCVKTKNGVYFLPSNTPDLLNQIENPKDVWLSIALSKVSGSLLEDFKAEIADDGIQLLADPFEFEVSLVGRNGTIVDSFGSTYVERWLPLPEFGDEADMVGIVVDLAAQKYQSVPTKFVVDESGHHWAVLKRNGNSTYAVVKSKRTFADVGNHWAKKDIELLASKLIVKGMNNILFAPDDKVTRAQYLTMLTNALGLKAKSNEQVQFKDISPGDWYASPIKAAVEAGLVSGYPDGRFLPDKEITRLEMVSLTIRALEYVKGKQAINTSVLTVFTDDSKIGSWGRPCASVAVSTGLISGMPDGKFAPDKTATRAQSASIIRRLLEHLDFIAS